jgi:hypothetical protein
MTTAISGTITESLPPTDWVVRTSRLDTGAFLADTAVDTTSSGAYSASCGTYAGPVMATCLPAIGVRWSAAASTALNSYAFPADCSNTPYFFKATAHADPHISSVKLLIRCDGGDGGTAFADETGKAVTPVGGVTTSSAQQHFSANAGYFAAAGDYLYTPNSADFDFGSGDMTIRLWVYITADSAQNGDTLRIADLVSTWDNISSQVAGYRLYILGSPSATGTGLGFDTWGSTNNSTRYSGPASVSKNAWHHIECCISAGVRYLFLDGELVAGATTIAGTGYAQANSLGSVLRVAKSSNAVYGGVYGHDFIGYMQDVEVYKGVALHTASFTVPAALAYGPLTGASEPSWNTATGGTTSDAAFTWTCMGPLIQPVTQAPLMPA